MFKVYAIGYNEIDGVMIFHKFIDVYLSTRIIIDSTEYETLKMEFNTPHRSNKYLCGSYFLPKNITNMCNCTSSRDMGHLDSLFDGECGNCGKTI